MSKLNSNNVAVFPCVSRELDDTNKSLTGKLMSEKNITNMIKSITDIPSYIISWEDVGNSTLLKCVINGYYFEIGGITKSCATGNTIKYLELQMDNTTDDTYSRINGIDTPSETTPNTKEFNGIEVVETSNLPETMDKPYLILLEGGNVIPDTSYAKFNIKSLQVPISLDCGVFPIK